MTPPIVAKLLPAAKTVSGTLAGCVLHTRPDNKSGDSSRWVYHYLVNSLVLLDKMFCVQIYKGIFT